MDALASFFAQPTARRGLLLALFMALLLAFKDLLPMFAAYAIFVQVFLWGAGVLRWRTRLDEPLALTLVLLLLTIPVVSVVLGAWAPAQRALEWGRVHWDGLGALEDQVMSNPSIKFAVDRLGGLESIKQRLASEETLGHLTAGTGRVFASSKAVLTQGLMAFFLAFLYARDRHRVAAILDSLAVDSIPRTLARWVGFVGQAFAITAQLQVVVALCNTLITLPVLWAMGIPNVGAVMVFIFIAGLIPVVGNFASAIVLCALAWSTKGWVGIPVFLGLALVLGKIESFYLTPRLASQHVKVPAFILTLSLVIFELKLGFIGLFLSFPFLFVFAKIRNDLRPVEPVVPAEPAAAG